MALEQGEMGQPVVSVYLPGIECGRVRQRGSGCVTYMSLQ